MALIIDTATIDREKIKEPLRLHAYCALDALVTSSVHAEISKQLDSGGEGVRSFEAEVYEFSRALQAPVLDMMQCGLRVNEYARGKLIDSLSRDRRKLEARLKRLIFEGLELTIEDHPWLAEWNHRSINPPTESNPHGGDVQRLLYEVMALPKITAYNGKPSVDRDALERLMRYSDARPICAILIALRDIDKTLGDLKMEADRDGRIRTTLSVAGTKTGRLASYTASSGRGRNLQNCDPQFRHIFISDTGTKFAYPDLEQAESRAVGAIIWSLFGDATYLDACEATDLHSEVAKMVWPEIIKTREDSEQPFYRNFSYRFLCKRISHGSNYYGTPRTISAETTVPIKVVEEFQERYFRAFPAIRRWHQWTSQQIASQGFLVSMMGRKRFFMGKADEDSTLREAIAYDPQSSIADLMNRGLFRLWWLVKTQPELYPVRLLLQVHDAILCQYPEDADEEVLIPRIIKALETPILLRHKDQTRKLIVPGAAKIGWDWSEVEYDKEGNVIGSVDGLKSFKGKRDNRKRSFDPEAFRF